MNLKRTILALVVCFLLYCLCLFEAIYLSSTLKRNGLATGNWVVTPFARILMIQLVDVLSSQYLNLHFIVNWPDEEEFDWRAYLLEDAEEEVIGIPSGNQLDWVSGKLGDPYWASLQVECLVKHSRNGDCHKDFTLKHTFFNQMSLGMWNICIVNK